MVRDCGVEPDLLPSHWAESAHWQNFSISRLWASAAVSAKVNLGCVPQLR